MTLSRCSLVANKSSSKVSPLLSNVKLSTVNKPRIPKVAPAGIKGEMLRIGLNKEEIVITKIPIASMFKPISDCLLFINKKYYYI